MVFDELSQVKRISRRVGSLLRALDDWSLGWLRLRLLGDRLGLVVDWRSDHREGLGLLRGRLDNRGPGLPIVGLGVCKGSLR